MIRPIKPRCRRFNPRSCSAVAADGAPTATLSADGILETIERLAELRRKDILTEEEFSAKKAELLARL
jgi:Short C-terminal domain